MRRLPPSVANRWIIIGRGAASLTTKSQRKVWKLHFLMQLRKSQGLPHVLLTRNSFNICSLLLLITNNREVALKSSGKENPLLTIEGSSMCGITFQSWRFKSVTRSIVRCFQSQEKGGKFQLEIGKGFCR